MAISSKLSYERHANQKHFSLFFYVTKSLPVSFITIMNKKIMSVLLNAFNFMRLKYVVVE